jgi:hypothetical protein
MQAPEYQLQAKVIHMHDSTFQTKSTAYPDDITGKFQISGCYIQLIGSGNDDHLQTKPRL